MEANQHSNIEEIYRNNARFRYLVNFVERVAGRRLTELEVEQL